MRGEKVVLGFVTHAASGSLLGIDVLVHRDSVGLVEWLSGYVSRSECRR